MGGPVPSLIAVFDVDGTLLPGNIGIAFVKYLNRHSAIRALPKILVVLGFVVYKMRLASFRLAIKLGYIALAGLSVDEVSEFARHCFEEDIRHLIFCDAVREIESLKSRGALIVLATGAHEAIAGQLARYLNVDELVATRSAINNSRYGWTSIGGLPFQEAKRDLVKAVLQRMPLASESRVLVYTDEKKDLSLFDIADECIAVNADLETQRVAERNGGRTVTFA